MRLRAAHWALVGLAVVLLAWLRSKSRGFGRIQDRNCPAKRRLSRAILQEALSLPVLQRCPAGMDKLRIHQGRSGKKVLCFAEKRTRYSPAAETFRFLAEVALSAGAHSSVRRVNEMYRFCISSKQECANQEAAPAAGIFGHGSDHR